MAECAKAQRASDLRQVDERPVAEAVQVSVAEFLRSACGAGPTARDDVTQEDVVEMEGVPGRLMSTRRP